MLDAARRLIAVKGDDEFTTQELVAEAGVALQTFYRYFASKDELLLAIIGDAMTEACGRWVEAAADLPDPLARLRFYLTATLERLAADGEGSDTAAMRFVVSTHWRLHRLFPKQLAEAEKPFVDLVLGEVNAAVTAGLLNPPDPEWDTWFVAHLVRSVYHYYAYADKQGDDVEVMKENLWRFCLTALQGPEASGALSNNSRKGSQ